MALGSGIAERSRKEELKIMIRLEILYQTDSIEAVDNLFKELKYMKLAELQAYYSNLMKKRGDEK